MWKLIKREPNARGMVTGNAALILAILTAFLLCPDNSEAGRSISARFSGIGGPIQKVRHKRMNIQLKRQMRSLKNRREMRTIDKTVNELQRTPQQNGEPRSRKLHPDASKTAAPPEDGRKALDPAAQKTLEPPSRSSDPPKTPALESKSASEPEGPK